VIAGPAAAQPTNGKTTSTTTTERMIAQQRRQRFVRRQAVNGSCGDIGRGVAKIALTGPR